MKRIVIIGGGFAGIWSAIGAARRLHELHLNESEVQVTLINRDSYLGLRPRFYEKNPQHYRVPLPILLDPVGVRLIEGEVRRIDPEQQQVMICQKDKQLNLPYDRLVFAAGSQLVRPNITGLSEHAFSMDTFQDAVALDRHLKLLPTLPYAEGKYTVVVVGGGFTGIEIAAEMTSRLREIAKNENMEAKAKVVLIEKEAVIGPDLGANPRPMIEQALREMQVEIYTNESVTSIESDGVTLQTGERIAALTTIWSAGVKASDLAANFPVEKDRLGRVPVDAYLRVKGVRSVYAAGDTACAKTDDIHISLMSCQHAMPQGKFAGHNVVCNLLGEEEIPYKQERYVTCLDLGSWGALVTKGWDRIPQYYGKDAKRIKMNINQSIIYPPLSGNRQELFEAAKLVIREHDV